MSTKANVKVRTALLQANMKQYELAQLLDIYEEKLSRMLRYELPEEEQNKMIEVIERHAQEVKK